MPTRINTVTMQTLTEAERTAWTAIPVTIASDVTAGAILADPRIRPLRPFPLGERMVGRAVTGWCERADFGPALHAIDSAQEGDVVVLDAGGSIETAYAGELLCGVARRKKLAGFVINGAVRDVDTLADWSDFPVYCLGTTGRGPLSKERGAVLCDIVLGGVPVKPGDIIIGDNDGLVAIPRADAGMFLDAMQERVRMEQAWSAELEAGRSLIEVFSVPSAV